MTRTCPKAAQMAYGRYTGVQGIQEAPEVGAGSGLGRVGVDVPDSLT